MYGNQGISALYIPSELNTFNGLKGGIFQISNYGPQIYITVLKLS